MRSGRVFWGTFFLFLGGLFLVDRFVPIDVGWWELWRLWPVVLVMIGVSMLLRQKLVRIALVVFSALLLAFVLFATFSFLRYGGVRGAWGREVTEELSVPLTPEVRTASLKLDLAAARVRLGGSTNMLLDAHTSTEGGGYVLEDEGSGEHASLRLAFEPARRNWRLGGGENRLELRLSEVPVWRIELDCGATSADIDLSGRRVEEVAIDAGASAIRLRLGGDLPEARVHVQAGVSSIRLEVPEDVGCEIRSETGLSSRKFGGFRKEASGLYRTDNFGESRRRIFIKLNAGISSLRVGRYL